MVDGGVGEGGGKCFVVIEEKKGKFVFILEFLFLIFIIISYFVCK